MDGWSIGTCSPIPRCSNVNIGCCVGWARNADSSRPDFRVRIGEHLRAADTRTDSLLAELRNRRDGGASILGEQRMKAQGGLPFFSSEVVEDDGGEEDGADDEVVPVGLHAKNVYRGDDHDHQQGS